MKNCEIPCKICGSPTVMWATKLCNNCYEITSKLEDFVATEGGYAFVVDVMILQHRKRMVGFKK